MRNSMTLITAILIGAVLVWSAVTPTGVVAEMSMEQLIESAKTKADHEALAAHYEAEAQALQEKANTHKRMSAAYRIMPSKGGAGGFTAHCDRLIARYEEAAKENLELATLHRQMAAEAGQ